MILCWAFRAIVASVACFVSNSAFALVIAGNPINDNYVAPVGAADPGWANLASSHSAIYLGDGWVIGARHSGLITSITFDAGTFDVIPGTFKTLTNEAGLQYVAHFNGGAKSNASIESDIAMYRIDTANRYGGTLEELAGSALKQITIATATPSVGTNLTFLATGRTRSGDSTVTVPYTSNGNPTSTSGYNVNTNDATSRRKAWGTNQVISDANALPNEPADADINTTIRVAAGNRDTVSLLARFDNNINNEAHVAGGDSGGGVFFRQGGTGPWLLTGHLHSLFGFEDQAGSQAAFGNVLAFSDFTNPHYNAQITDSLNQANYSKLGDINLDGVVNGDGTGSWENDDVTAFIEGWTAQQSIFNLTAGIVSWKLGDLDQNGITDIADFLTLRKELGATGASLNLANLLSPSSGAVPEPTGIVALLVAMLTGLTFARLGYLRARLAL